MTLSSPPRAAAQPLRAARSKLGVGIIGAGGVTRAIHLPTLARLSETFEVRHVHDIAQAAAADVAARVGARWSTSLEELLADKSVDVVAVCSPHQLHAAQVIASCRAGKRGVLCEKPFAMSGREADEIAQVARETAVPILVGAMHTFDPGWRAAVANWGDLPAKRTFVRSSIVLPSNSRFQHFATEVGTQPSKAPPAGTGRQADAGRMHSAIMGLTIHDLPLVRVFLPDFDDLQILHAQFFQPYGYHVVFTAGGVRVELHAVMSATWQPDWVFDVAARDQWLHVQFTPSFVQAGSAVSTLHRPGASTTFGPYVSNGYEGEWRELAEIVHGQRARPDPTPLIDDLRFALALADAASDHVRHGAGEDAAA